MMAEYEKKVRVILKEHGCMFVRHGRVLIDSLNVSDIKVFGLSAI